MSEGESTEKSLSVQENEEVKKISTTMTTMMNNDLSDKTSAEDVGDVKTIKSEAEDAVKEISTVAKTRSEDVKVEESETPPTKTSDADNNVSVDDTLSTKPPLPVVFIDMPDPDNFVSALATYKLLFKECSEEKHRQVLHVVISGRPTNLESKSLTPKELGSLLKSGVKIGDILKRSSTETDIMEHSERVLEDGAVCLANFLIRHGVDESSFFIYNGGIAPSAPVSHRMHAREFLFDRADLVKPGRQQGEIITGEEYYELVRRFDNIENPKERAEKTLNILRRSTRSNVFRPIEDLLVNIGDQSVKIILGGPATAITKLLNHPTLGTKFYRHIHSLHGMYGAWDNAKPGTFNLFPNQFNVAADMDAAIDLLIRRRSTFPMYFVPTETCKDKRLALDPESLKKILGNDLYERGNGTVVKMYELWFNIQGRRPFFIFDMAPVLSASKDYGHIYKMVDVNATFEEEAGVLRMSKTEDDAEEKAEDESSELSDRTMLMAMKELSSDAIKSYFAALSEVFSTCGIVGAPKPGESSTTTEA